MMGVGPSDRSVSTIPSGSLLYRMSLYLCVVALPASTATAQLSLDRVFPSAVVIGSESTVRGEGKFPDWPVEIYCDHAGVSVSSGEMSGELTVRVSETAAPGVAWIRLFDHRSASSLVPLLIESVPVVEELEPNDGLSEAQPVELPAVVAGRLEKGGDVDAFRVSLGKGETLVASLVANRILQAPMDGVLQIADLRGNVLAQADDVRGLDPQLIYRAETDVELMIRLFAFPETATSSISFAGDPAFVYALRLTSGPFLDHVEPIVTGSPTETAIAVGWNLSDSAELKRADPQQISPPTWTVSGAVGWHLQPSLDPQAVNVRATTAPETPPQAASLPVVFSGQIRCEGQIDRLRFKAQAGQRYLARSHAKMYGFLIDPVLRVVEVGGEKIGEKDDQSRTDFDASLEFSVKQDTEVELQVFDAVDRFGPRHSYGVWLGPLVPAVKLSVAADHFSLPAGGELEIPVTIDRVAEFSEPLSVTVEGLPQGVQVTEAVSEPKGDSAKSVKLKLSAAEGTNFQGSFRIMGSVQGASEEPAVDVRSSKATRWATYRLRDDVLLNDFWLSVADSP